MCCRGEIGGTSSPCVILTGGQSGDAAGDNEDIGPLCAEPDQPDQSVSSDFLPLFNKRERILIASVVEGRLINVSVNEFTSEWTVRTVAMRFRGGVVVGMGHGVTAVYVTDACGYLSAFPAPERPRIFPSIRCSTGSSVDPRLDNDRILLAHRDQQPDSRFPSRPCFTLAKTLPREATVTYGR